MRNAFSVIAQHGPWAVLAFYLTWRALKGAEAQTAAMVKVAEALTALKTHIEVALPNKGDDND